MPLTAEQVYNDLNGEEAREILVVRLADLLNSIPEFRRNISITRARMKLSVVVDVHGRTPPKFEVNDNFTISVRNPGEAPLDIEVTHELSAEINSDTTTEKGQPPDQIREEHGLPVMEPRRGPMGMEDIPVVREDGRRYAAFVTQDYGPARFRSGMEGPVVGTIRNTHGGSGVVSPDMSRLTDSSYREDNKIEVPPELMEG